MAFRTFRLFLIWLAFYSSMGTLMGFPMAGLFSVTEKAEIAQFPASVELYPTHTGVKIVAMMPHPDISSIACRAKTSRERVWEDESMEFFICSSDIQEDSYLHYMVNADGVVRIAQGTVPRPKYAEQVQVSVSKSRSQGSWRLELMIPWNQLGGRFRRQSQRRFNFLRTVKIGDVTMEISSWSHLDLGAHEPYNFGYLAYDGDSLTLIPAQVYRRTSTIANGGFETSLSHWLPMSWINGDMYGEGTFSYSVVSAGAEGRHALQINGSKVGPPKVEGARMGVIGDPVSLVSGKYVFEGYYRCTSKIGASLSDRLASVSVSGVKQELFLAESHGWKRFECVFEVKKRMPVRPLVRLWSNGTVWFDALTIVPWQEKKQSPVLLSTERIVDGRQFTLIQPEIETAGTLALDLLSKNGLVLFQRSPEKLQPDSAPINHELYDSIGDVAVPGTHLVHFLNLYGAGSWNVRIQGDAVSADWMTLSKIPFWLQRTDYDGREIRWIAEVLHPMGKTDCVDISKNQIGVLALTIDIPEDADPRCYRHTICFREVGSNQRVYLPLQLDVKNIHLPEASPEFGMWVSSSQIPHVLEFMSQAGVSGAIFPMSFNLTKDPKGRVHLDATKSIEQLMVAKRAGMRFPIPIELTTLSTDLAKLLGFYDRLPKDVTFDSSHLICPLSDKDYPIALTLAYQDSIKQLYKQLRGAGLADKVLFYPVDEPTSNRHRMSKALHEGSLIKKTLPDARVFMTAHDLVLTEKLAQGHALDVVCLALGTLTSNQDWARRFFSMAARNDLEVWSYTGSTSEDYLGMRRLGVKLIGLPVKRLMLWVSYFDTADTRDTLNDLRASLKRVATFYPMAGGSYLSTIQWEGIRQSILDLRYWKAAELLSSDLAGEERKRWISEMQDIIKPLQDSRKMSLQDFQVFRNKILTKMDRHRNNEK